MGICASCLGLNRHSSHDEVDETDALLDGSHQAQYGGFEGEEEAQPDQEELRKGRDELERITAEATDNMIDVSHPSSHHFTHTNHERHTLQDSHANGPSKTADPADDDEEAAWLQSVQATGADTITHVKGLQSGALVLDIGQLRSDAPASLSKRSEGV